jgi:hypothetical protein
MNGNNVLDMTQQGIHREAPELPAPDVVRDTAISITFVPADPSKPLQTLDSVIAFNDLLEVQGLMRRGRVVIQLAGGLGERRVLDLGVAEAVTLFTLLHKFLPVTKP